LAHVFCAMNGKKTKVGDFMPKHDQTEPEGPSINEVFGMLKAQAKKGKK
jgi:predicted RNA-binding protein (virulence factor B family)